MRTELSSEMKANTSARGSLAISWGLAIGITLIAINMRAPITAVGPLVGMIRDELALSNTWAGMLTTLPLVAFALFSLAAPWLVRRYSIEWVLMASVIVLTAGIALRSAFGVGTLFFGTLLIGTGISLCNVLLPGLVKREFPQQVGFVTGLYLVSMNLFGAIGSGLSIPLASGLGLGWKGALGIWAIFGIITILVWVPQFRHRRTETARVHAAGGSEKKVNMWRSFLAWQVTIFMGMQSLVYYVMITWVPEILISKGMDIEHAGWVLSVMMLALIPFTFFVPIIAGRLRDQRILVYVMALTAFGGTLGLLYGSLKTAWFWVLILGISTAIAFSTALMFFTLRTRTAQQAAELSGMAQAAGYLMAAVGPALFGYLYDVTGNWTVPLYLLLGVIALLVLAGFGSGKRRYVGETERAAG
jgi:CP family cyanate transporter-like MFS transporter